MRWAVKTLIVVVLLAILIHDAASGRFSTFRNLFGSCQFDRPLRNAVEKGDIGKARYLLRRCADVNTKQPDSFTPLLLAIRAHHKKEMAELLIDWGADLNVRLKSMTPLHYDLSRPIVCSGKKQYENVIAVAHLLIERGADINARTVWGETPVHMAVGAFDASVAQHLIQEGADVRSKDKCGQTPLHRAAFWGRRGFAEAIRKLIENGADVNATDDNGRTPLDEARRNADDREVVDLLVKHGAKPGSETAKRTQHGQ